MYRLTQAGGVIRVEDGAYVPNDVDNTDWQAYLAWLDAGNTPLPIEVPVVPPNLVLSRVAFLKRFDPSEVLAIRARAPSDPHVDYLLFMLTNSDPIHLDDTLVVTGINYLAAVGLLTSDRAATILAP
jgi:hypothetical protein